MFHLFVAQVLYRHEEGEAGIEVSWSSQSMPLQAVPSSSFFRPLPLSNASYPLTIVPAMTHPPSSTAVGPGTSAATAGVTANFTVLHRKRGREYSR